MTSRGQPARPASPEVVADSTRDGPGRLTLIGARGAEGAAAGRSKAGLARLLEQAGWPVEPGAGGELVLIEAADESASILSAALASGRAADAVGLHLAGDQLAEVISTPLSGPGSAEAAAIVAASLGRTVVRCPGPARVPGRDAAVPASERCRPDAAGRLRVGRRHRRGDDARVRLPARPAAHARPGRPGRALAVLTRMHERYGDPAFAPVPLLAEYAAAGLAFAPPPR